MLVLLHPTRGHSSILMQLQSSDPIFSMGVDVGQHIILKSNTGLLRWLKKQWTRGPGTPPTVQVLIRYRWVQDGGRNRGRSLWTICRKKAQHLPREICNSSASRDKCYVGCAYEIHVDVRPEKYVSTCSDNQAALKALQAARTSQLVQKCQKAFNDISTQHSAGLFRVPDVLGHKEMKLPMSSQGRELFTSLLDWNGLLGSLGRIQEEWLNTGLTTSIQQCGEVLPVLRNGLKIWSQALVLLLN